MRLAIPPAWTGEGDFGIVVDARGGMDVAITYEGKTVLLIERAVAENLVTSELDFKTPAGGPRFTLDVY